MLRNDVRTRLTLWHVGALTVILVGFSVVVYGLHGRDLSKRLDGELRVVSSTTRITVQHESEEAAAGQPAGAEIEAESLAEHLAQFHPAIIVLNESGKVLFEKPVSGTTDRRLPRAAMPMAGFGDSSFREAENLRILLARVETQTPRRTFFVAVGEPLDPMRTELASLRRTLLISCPVALLGVGLLGWFLVGKTLAPVLEMSAQARLIGEGNLDQRLPIARPDDELGYLARTFNDLLGRVQAAFERQRQFMVDASHELRTPLSVIRTTTEVTLDAPERTESEYRDALAITAAQTRRLTRIVEDMFLLARGDANQNVMRPTALYLDEVISEAVRTATVLARENGTEIKLEPLPEMPYRGDEALLRQLLLNLLDNGIKFTPSGGEIRVRAVAEANRYVLTVADTGQGIPEASRPFVFDRFYRVEASRPNRNGVHGSGAGLGLAIARRISELHHATIELTASNQDGSVFTVILPHETLQE